MLNIVNFEAAAPPSGLAKRMLWEQWNGRT